MSWRSFVSIILWFFLRWDDITHTIINIPTTVQNTVSLEFDALLQNTYLHLIYFLWHNEKSPFLASCGCLRGGIEIRSLKNIIHSFISMFIHRLIDLYLSFRTLFSLVNFFSTDFSSLDIHIKVIFENDCNLYMQKTVSEMMKRAKWGYYCILIVLLMISWNS